MIKSSLTFNFEERSLNNYLQFWSAQLRMTFNFEMHNINNYNNWNFWKISTGLDRSYIVLMTSCPHGISVAQKRQVLLFFLFAWRIVHDNEHENSKFLFRGVVGENFIIRIRKIKFSPTTPLNKNFEFSCFVLPFRFIFFLLFFLFVLLLLFFFFLFFFRLVLASGNWKVAVGSTSQLQTHGNTKP